MLSTLANQSGFILIVALIFAVFYVVLKVAVRAEQTQAKRSELMERVKRMKKKLDPDAPE